MLQSEIIKSIRQHLQMTQTELAAKLGVSYATVNRWEQGHCKPSRIAMNALRGLCEENSIKYSDFEGAFVNQSTETITLYHGSKSGITGRIEPNSREHCDFGRGFYMGTDRHQPLTLICNFPEAKLYTVSMDLSGLNLLNVEVGLDWAMLIAYHRGKLENIKESSLYQYYANLENDVDVVVGLIANDRMFVVLDRFFNGEITDKALVSSLSALQLGKQHVAITQKACDQVKIIEEKSINDEERTELKKMSEENRAKGIAIADEICRKYRREGKFFDEILEGR